MRTLARLVLPVALLCGAAGALADPHRDASQDTSAINLQTPRADLEKLIVNKHPAAYLLYARQLLEADRGDEATFWFYVGQLRYRFDLEANPHGDPSGSPALFGALLGTVGEEINVRAGADPGRWAHQIDEALHWDARHPNGFTSKTRHTRELAKVRGALAELRDTVASNKDRIRAEREQNGVVPDRLVDGVYVRERREKMPLDWPALAVAASAEDTLRDLAGTYADSGAALLGPLFFFDDETFTARSLSEVELRLEDEETLQVVGRRDGSDVLSKTVAVRFADGAAVFEYSRPTPEGTSSETHVVVLHRNTAGEIVVERTSVTEGHYEGSSMPVRQTYTFWNRAPRVR